MEIVVFITKLFWIGILVLIGYCVAKTFYTVHKFKKRQRTFMEIAETMINVEHKGVEMPIRKGELPRWNSMNREQKNDMVADYLRHVKKGKVVEVGSGIVFRKDVLQKITA